MIDTILQENTPFSVGQILKTSRLERGLSLQQISKSLCITQQKLSHLEEDTEHLVCDVYTLGFVRLYAQYLELNATEIVEMFKAQAIHPPTLSELVVPAPLPGRGIPSFRILIISLFVLIAIVIGWKWLPTYFSPEIIFDKDESTVENPPPSPIPQATVPDSPAKEENRSLILEPTHRQVSLHTTEATWIEVRDKKGNILISRMFQPGESFKFKNSEDLILKTGNLNGTYLSTGDKVFPISGKFEEIGQDIPLDPERWLE